MDYNEIDNLKKACEKLARENVEINEDLLRKVESNKNLHDEFDQHVKSNFQKLINIMIYLYPMTYNIFNILLKKLFRQIFLFLYRDFS